MIVCSFALSTLQVQQADMIRSSSIIPFVQHTLMNSDLYIPLHRVMQDDVDLAWECGVQTSCTSPLGSVDREALCTYTTLNGNLISNCDGTTNQS